MHRILPALVMPLLTLVACSQDTKGSLGAPDGADLSDGRNTDDDNDGVTADTDCDDDNDQVFPGAVERCDGIDNNCDGLVDDDDPALDTSTAETWFGDSDSDGHGDMNDRVLACEAPLGTVLSGADCDDANSNISPDATEVCDGIDNNCDGAIDDDDPALDLSSRDTWFLDTDDDGFGDADSVVESCARPEGAVDNDLDCDDDNPAVNPDATEVCDDDNIDEDCNGVADDEDSGVDPASATLFYADSDNDGFGDMTDDGTLACEPISGTVNNQTDCDDGDDAVNPDATEVCDDIDNDCDGDIDDDDPSVDPATQTLFYTDSDADGYGSDTATGALYCDGPSGTSALNTDCDDRDDAINPGATELCNGIDDDCSPSTTEADLVSFEDTTGTFTDLSALFSGTSTSASSYTSTGNGTLWFCDGTFYTHLTVEHDLTIASASGIVVLDGADGGRVVDIEDDGLTIDIEDVIIQHGYEQYGAGVACVGSNNTTVVSLSNVELSNNEASDFGGGALAWYCDLDISDSTISDNTAESAGGIAYYGSAVGRIFDSTVEGNFANTFGGGLGIYAESTLTLDNTLVTDNSATFFGGGADLYDGGDLTCSGSSSTTSGFHGNTAALYGGGISFDESGATNRFTADTCDLGVHLSADDNAEYDIVSYNSSSGSVLYGYFLDDDENFTCTGGRCGTSADYSHSTSLFAAYDSRSGAYFRGNYYEIAGTPTLDTFSMYLTTAADCVVDLYAHSSLDGGTTWTLLYAEEVLARSGGDDITTSAIGVPLYDAELILLSAGWDGAECGDSVRYDAFSTALGSNVGFGTFEGRTMDNAYPGYDTSYGGFNLTTSSAYGYEVTATMSMP